MDTQKVIVYIDGFNFYYGLKKNPRWRRYYWLDVVKFFETFMRPSQNRDFGNVSCRILFT